MLPSSSYDHVGLLDFAELDALALSETGHRMEGSLLPFLANVGHRVIMDLEKLLFSSSTMVLSMQKWR